MGFINLPGTPDLQNTPIAGDTSSPSYVGSNLVSSADDDLQKRIVNIMNSNLSAETKDYLVQYFSNDSLSKNAFNREYEASKSQYQNTVKDLQKAGISPMLAFDSLRTASASSSAGSVSGGLASERRNTKDTIAKDNVGKILQVLGIIAAAFVYAMA